MIADALQVLAEKPISVPVVLLEATTMQQIADLEARIHGLKIVDEVTAQDGADLKRQVVRLENQIETARKDVKKPFLDMERAIDLAARQPAARLSSVKSAIQTELNAYLAEQERLRRERDRIIAAENARVARDLALAQEKLRLEQEAEAKRVAEEARQIAAEQDRLAAAASDDMPVEIADEAEAILDEEMPPDAPSEAERVMQSLIVRSAELSAAPAPVAAKPTGLRKCVGVVYDVEALYRVPEELLRPRELNVIKVRQLYVNGWREGDPLPVVPGLKFRMETNYV